jgi:SAM-dependent methyltransferase
MDSTTHSSTESAAFSPPNVMKDFYERNWSDPRTYARGDKLADTRRRMLWDWARQYNVQPKALLDVGSGEGALVADAQARGLHATGMDIAEAAARRARARHPDCTFVVNAIEDRPWPFDPEAFDIVASFEVIEHLVRPADLIKGVYEVLRSGGYLALTTPYHGVAKNVAIAAYGYENHYRVEGGHIRFFTDPGLIKLIESNGFSVREFAHIGRRWPLWKCSYVWAQKPR